ncbi:hypothetical protein AVEN_158475-1 [Araneus ventricosus]|uniref:Uncharacterized protein n=1 Tax=Araneus ventricosus TaxID=182803 RepID=A0A4Y2KXL8_ARAVE|nr:hypothetical protein AVEN_158475-1 [Araneus ventricosus]
MLDIQLVWISTAPLGLTVHKSTPAGVDLGSVVQKGNLRRQGSEWVDLRCVERSCMTCLTARAENGMAWSAATPFARKRSKKKLSVLFMKPAERLYDLRHALGYTTLEEIKYMAHETLTVDVELAEQYFGPEIAAALATAAGQALKIYNRKK